MNRISVAIALLGAGAAVSAPAIVVRHDVADSRYRALGQRHRLSVVDIAVPNRAGTPDRGNGAGTLVSPQWVLTAAHVAMDVDPGRAGSRVREPHSVWFEGRPYRIAQVHMHPGWSGSEVAADVALLKLAEPVPGARPACLYPARDEAGKVTTLVGWGEWGTGLTGPTERPGVLRGATVRIDAVSHGGRVLRWNFRAPGQAGVTALEGISGGGDSGGPAFLMHRGRLCIAGVSSSQNTNGLAAGRYGVTEFYPRVSHFRPWIEAVMRANG